MSINLTDEIEVKTKKGKLCAAKQIFLEGDIQTVEKEIQDINSRHNTLNTKHESLGRTVQGIAATGGASTATNVTYNNDASGLNAENAQDAIDEVSSMIIYDVSAHNNGAVFESIQALLSNSNLSTLIPTSIRYGGMTIRFIKGSEHSSDNKYVQYRLMTQNFTTDVTQWQCVDEKVSQIEQRENNSRCCWIVNGKAFEDRAPWECNNYPNFSYILLSAYKKVYLKTIPYNIIEFSEYPNTDGTSNVSIYIANHVNLSDGDFKTEKDGFISFGLNSETKYVVLVYLQPTISQSELDFYSALQPICQELQTEIQQLRTDMQEISGIGTLVKNKAFDNTQTCNVITLYNWIYILFKKPIYNRVYLKQKPKFIFEFSEYPNTDGASNESINLSMVTGNSLSQTDYGVYYYDIKNSNCQYVAIDFNSLYTAEDLGIISYKIKGADEYEDALNKKYGIDSYVLNKAFDNNANANVINLDVDYWRYLLLKRVSNYIYFKVQPKFIFEFSQYPNVDGTSNASILLNYQLTPITTTNEFGYYVYEIKDSACQYIGIDYVNNDCSLNELGVFCYFNDFLINKLTSEIEELKNKQKQAKNFVQVFHSDFSEQGSWVNVGTDSTYTPWTIDTANKCAYPTHLGGYIQDGNNKTLKSTLGLPRVYFYDQRRTTFDIILYTDTIFNIHFYRGVTNNAGQRQSHYQIDCANGLLKMMKYIESGHIVTDEVLISEQIPFNIVNGRKYTVKCTKNDFTFSIELIDGITSESVILTYTGWGGGSNMFYHGFSWEAGATAPKLSNFSIWELAEPLVVELGDSITEGDGFDSNVYSPNTMNLYTRWAYKLNQILGNSYLCACTSATIQHVIEQFETELQYIKPKYAIITIGTNNPSMSAADKYIYYQQMKSLCEQYGITLLLSHIPLTTWNNYKQSAEEANPYIDLIPGYHAKLDIAIAKDYDINQGCDVNKTWDGGMHPNLLGANCFLERIKNDYSFLFK